MADSTRNERGQHLVMLAIMFPVLLAMFGFVVDLGVVYLHHRWGQNAADAAALAGATALCAGQDATSAALDFANRNGYPNTGTSVVNVQVGDVWVRVTVQDVVDPIFTKVLWNGTFTVPASAKAACADAAPWPSVLILNHTYCDSLYVGTGTLKVPLGYIHVNSDGTAGHGGCSGGEAAYVQHINGIVQTLNASQFRGSCPTCVGNPNVTPPPITGPTVPQFPDPLEWLYKPNPDDSYPSDCKVICQENPLTATKCGTNPMPWKDPVTLRWHYPPGIYKKSVTVNTGETAYFDNTGQTTPLTCASTKLYAFQDILKINGTATVIGHDMMWFFEASKGELNIAGGANLDLSAATTGYYKNILIYQQRGNTNICSVQGNSGSLLTGVIYVPSGELALGGAPGSEYSATVVVDRLSLNGGPIVSVNGLSGGEGSYHWVRLVE